MYQHIFELLGINQTQSEILDLLLNKGDLKAAEITKKLKRPRGVIYKELDELFDQNLIKKRERKGGATIFKPVHPQQIFNIFNQKQKELELKKEKFKDKIPELIQLYDKISPKPKIQYFEDETGFKEVIFDSLKTKDEICTFSDAKSIRINQTTDQINREYMQKRSELKIKKRIIIPSSHKHYFKKFDKKITKIRYLDSKNYPFNTTIQIYNNKVSFQSNIKNKLFAILIEDPMIKNTQQCFFNYIWGKLKNREL